ncbi:MAG TPA: hypothetical protein VGI45_23100 [Terracidiphilus sp.]|jgi:hypothetical protein
MTISKLDESAFANVDLDIWSADNLRPLVDAMGDRVIEMRVGKVRRTYEAHLEIGWSKKQTPTSIILRFCSLVEALTPSKRRLWDGAKTKSFDIGIYAVPRHRHYWSAISAEAVRASAKVGAQIAITVYGPMRAAKPAKKKRSSSSSK